MKNNRTKEATAPFANGSDRWSWWKQQPFLWFALLSLLFFGAGLDNDYADDAWRVTSDYTRRNLQVEQGLSGIPEIFSSRYSEVSDGLSTVASYGYRPLPEATFALEWALWGQAPGAGHCINLLLYAVLCTLFYRLLHLLFPETRKRFLFFAALLFLIHPMHSEVVLAHKNREALLAGIFGLLYLTRIHAFLESGSPKQFWLAMSVFALGLFCKDDIFLFMTVVPGLWWIKFKGTWNQVPKQIIPFLKHYFVPLLIMLGVVALLAAMGAGSGLQRNLWFLPAMVVLAIYSTVNSQRLSTMTSRMAVVGFFSLGLSIIFLSAVNLSLGQPQTQDMFWENPLFESAAPGEHAALVLKSMGFYLRIFFVPYPLSVYYGFDTLQLDATWNVDTVLGIISFLLLLSAPYWVRKQHPMLQLGLFWHAMGLLLLSNVVFPMTGIVAERYFFSASFGLCLMVLGASERLPWKRWSVRDSGAWKLAGQFAGVALLLAAWIMNFSRAMDWSDYGSLYRKDAMRNPRSVKMTSMYAHHRLRNMPRNLHPEQLQQEFGTIVNLLDKALVLYPTYADVLNLKGNLLMDMGNFDQAIELFKLNATSNPWYKVSYNNLGTAYLEHGKFSLSAQAFRQAVAAEPNAIESHLGLTSAYVAMEYWDSAGASLHTMKVMGFTDPDMVYLDSLITRRENPFSQNKGGLKAP